MFFVNFFASDLVQTPKYFNELEIETSTLQPGLLIEVT